MIQVLPFMTVARSTKNSHSENQSWSVKLNDLPRPSSKFEWMCNSWLYISGGLINHHLFNSEERQEKVKNIMYEVGLYRIFDTLPLTNSQVVNVNGSVLPVHLSWNQNLSVVDEVISALDVSVRAQVLNLWKKFQRIRLDLLLSCPWSEAAHEKRTKTRSR